MIVTASFVLPMVLGAACGGGDDGEDADPFDNLMDCYNEHHVTEGLTSPHAITTCCLDHPIAGVKPACGDSEAACETFVGDNLDDTVPDADIMSACMDYATQRGID
ncbi:MAG TPA: hypothetical protein VGM88_19160 [Kofleriaceae bacterium]